AKILGQNLSPAGTGQNEENCYQLLKDQHEDVFRKESAVQTALDQKQNIHISPVKAAFPADRVRKAAHSLEDTTVSEDVIRRRAENAVANIANSFHDDYIKENSSFRQKAGLSCHVSRIGASKCCSWCAKLAGRYEKGREPADFWKRHDKCSCRIIYENSKSRQQLSGNGNGWKVDSEIRRRQNAAKIQYKPTRFTPEQAAALEHQRLSQYRGLTVAGKNDIMNLERRNQNLGAFSEIEIPMQKKIVKQICKKYGIDIVGLHIKIQRDESLVGKPFCGMTDYDNIGRIDLLPSAFSSEEQLVRTIIHERLHVMQLRKHGKDYCQRHIEEMENQAYWFEDHMYPLLKKRVK
ncbi:MAG: hypothetical protein IJ642_05485, partial [Oscillospiraceae bacterium]|nr:hypothetical protein [Oscillospiraceae bacterium]